MTARLIDGRVVAAELRTALAAQIASLPFKPGLTVVLVGDDPASAVYVRNKDRAAAAVGIAVKTLRLPAGTRQGDLLTVIAGLNRDQTVDGILVQLPLPAHLDARAVIRAIDPAKDVDGLTPINAGLLAAGQPHLVPCTPMGVMKLLEAAGTTLRGARALVLGRSVLVGKPVAALLTAADATVTIAHSRTADLARECRRADILVAAVGRRRCRHRCRHQPIGGRTAGGRRGVRVLRRGGGRDHAGSGRCRAHDHRLPAGEHRHRRPGPPRHGVPGLNRRRCLDQKSVQRPLCDQSP
jgi:methylenetetrahydrofolate dehydrogenase (NADP+)/methenyltetrahydrofolate cyclohydrolase